jgi:hypothetical protein
MVKSLSITVHKQMRQDMDRRLVNHEMLICLIMKLRLVVTTLCVTTLVEGVLMGSCYWRNGSALVYNLIRLADKLSFHYWSW